MKYLIVLSIVALASARPEYPPSGGHSGGSNFGSAGAGGFQVTNGHEFAGQLFQLVGEGGSSGSASGFGGSSSGFGGSASGFGGSSSGFGGSSSGGAGGQLFQLVAEGGSSGAGFGGAASGFGGGASGATVTKVTKDIYVHVPPPEDPEEFEGGLGGGNVNRKHYKIIFIKAPSVSIEQQLALKSASGGEEKTIVYVLVKKPELITDLDLEKSSKGKNNKPEVYFIKYKSTKEGSGAAGSGSGAGAGAGVGGQLFQLVAENGAGGAGVGGSSFHGTGGSGPSTKYGPPHKK